MNDFRDMAVINARAEFGTKRNRPHTVSPYRVALEQAQAALMASLQRPPAPPEHSVTISRNAKGVAQFEVTVRGLDAEQTAAMAELIYTGLCDTHPYPAPNGAPE